MKGRLWCERIPTVKVARGTTPKRLTFIYPYYENAAFLQKQLAHWAGYPADIRDHLSVIVVDDGSPTPATITDFPFPVRLFRIEVDVRWNWLAARNLGAHHAEDGWLLLTDMDHMVPATTVHSLIYGVHDPTRVYAFSRVEHTGQKAAPHSASFLMTRAMFWKIGGYDERLSGHYGTDGEYRRRVAQIAPMLVLTDTLMRHEYQGDSSTTRYLRKQPEDAAVKGLIAARGRDWKPKVLSFPAHEVAL